MQGREGFFAALGHEFRENLHLWVAVFAAWREAGELGGQGRCLDRHGDKRARAQVFRDLVERFEDDARARQGPTGEHIAIIGFEGTGDFVFLWSGVGLQRPLEFFCPGEPKV